MFSINTSFLLGAVLIAAAVHPSARADQWDKKTTITINEPVEMPSCCTPDHVVVLAPGTYVMALVDSQSDRHIVRVFEKGRHDRSNHYPCHTELPSEADGKQRVPILGNSGRSTA